VDFFHNRIGNVRADDSADAEFGRNVFCGKPPVVTGKTPCTHP
jgi:hypothetical protein